MKVWLPQWPKGASARSLSPHPRASPQAGHLGRGRRLIEKHQPMRLLAHQGLAQMGPDVTLAPHPRASALRCDQGFFYMRSRGL